ncbi:MAG: hypothetical protein WD995_12810 [Gemmatimonadota bacterium]
MRLEVALSELERTIEYQESVEGSDRASAALLMAKRSLSDARDAFGDGKEQVAWAHCHQAFRFVLQALSPVTREARRQALRREAGEKLTNWRRDAVLDILDAEGEVEPENLALAQFLLDQHFANVYFKLNAAAVQFGGLRWVLIPTVLGLFGISFLLDASASDSFLHDPGTLAVVILAGGIGALLSSVLSQVGVGGRIPDFLSSTAGWVVRPFIGGLSAVIICIVIQSGLLPLVGDSELSLYAWAVAAGGSDQLVNVVMRRVEEAARS